MYLEMKVLLGSQVDILFLNDKIENIRGTVINIFEDSMRVEVETTKKHLIILKTAIATITLLD
ncbi:hypothetical protein [Enterococcus casseliflavus]|nr:hypothetical protein [Enterococcus casseliflavus]